MREYVKSIDNRRPFRRLDVSGQDLHESSLACPIWSEQPYDIPLFHMKGHIVKSGYGTVFFCDIDYVNHL